MTAVVTADAQPPRLYYCGECGTEETAQAGGPDGWYSVSRRNPGHHPSGWQRVALFCSAACLSLATPRIESRDRKRARQ